MKCFLERKNHKPLHFLWSSSNGPGFSSFVNNSLTDELFLSDNPVLGASSGGGKSPGICNPDVMGFDVANTLPIVDLNFNLYTHKNINHKYNNFL